MYTKKLAVMAIVLSASFFGSIGVANAMSPYTIGKFFFDENGQLVGQTVDTCQAQQYNGGNTHTAYFVMTEVYCGVGGCNINPNQPGCDVEYIVPNTYITEYTLPGFETVQEACAQMEQQCTIPPQRILDKGWTW